VVSDESFTVCPYCDERVEPDDPNSVYAVEQVEVLTMGPTREIIDGMGGYFHPGVPAGGGRLREAGAPELVDALGVEEVGDQLPVLVHVLSEDPPGVALRLNDLADRGRLVAVG
jgi:hypothetical protein